MIVYPCPLCGRSVNHYGDPFDEPYKTRAHIDGARDAEHDGERGGDYVDEIRESGREMTESERRGIDRNEANESDLSGQHVEVDLGVGESMRMPVERAVKLNATRIADPEGFGIASQGTAWKIRQENRELRSDLDALRDRVETLETAVAVLSAESDAREGECPECGGGLTVEVGDSSGGETAVVCTECGESPSS